MAGGELFVMNIRPSTTDHRSLQVNPPPMYGNPLGCRKSVIEICREIRRWNPSENVSRNLISVPLVRWNLRDVLQREIDWLKRPGQSVSIARVILKCLTAYHFCKRFQGNWNVLFWRIHSFFWRQRLMRGCDTISNLQVLVRFKNTVEV